VRRAGSSVSTAARTRRHFARHGALIEFATDAYGTVEIARVVDEKGVIGHAEFRIGDSVVLAFDALPDWPKTLAFLRLYVEDADESFKRAVSNDGARSQQGAARMTNAGRGPM
jgi:uncharacterized glyoxalase superfamily protein PhnB